MDAVPCDFYWQPAGSQSGDLESAPSLADQLSQLERYLRVAQGTGVGVIARFSSFFGPALTAAGTQDARKAFQDNPAELLRLMDKLLARQERVMRVVCDRFASELALVMITESVATPDGLMLDPELFQTVFAHRLERLVAAAKDHGKLLLMHSRGHLTELLPILHDASFDAVHSVEPECNDIVQVGEAWAGKLALVGNVSTRLLANGSRAQIEDRVKSLCTTLAPGGGYVLSSSAGITPEIAPASFVAMVQATHRYGRYKSLGHESTGKLNSKDRGG
jgi:uroporphyrinogen-III decarboxylase